LFNFQIKMGKKRKESETLRNFNKREEKEIPFLNRKKIERHHLLSQP